MPDPLGTIGPSHRVRPGVPAGDDATFPPITSKAELCKLIYDVSHKSRSPLDVCKRLDRSIPSLWRDGRFAVSGGV